MNNTQLEIDTRSDFQREIDRLIDTAVQGAYTLVKMSCETATEKIMPYVVHNRHEAYGVAAEQLVKIDFAAKTIKKDVGQLLDTLADPQKSALEATSSIYNTLIAAAAITVQAAAIIKRTTDNLYVEEAEIQAPTPLEELSVKDFEDAETITQEEE